MARTKKGRWLGAMLAVIGILIVGVFVVYEIVLPEYIARQYMAKSDDTVTTLRASFRTVEKTTETHVINDPSAPLAQKQQDLQTITAAISQVQKDLSKFRLAESHLPKPPFSGYTDSFKKAVLVEKDWEDISSQAQEVLRDYSQLAAFLGLYAEMQEKLEIQLEKFNQMQDLNVLSGQGQAMRAVAESLRDDGAAFSARMTPRDMQVVKERLLLAQNTTSDNFEDLADGLDNAVDATIYAAAANLESVSQQLSTTIPAAYSQTVQNSRAIKDIASLNEKLDLLELK